MSELVVEFLQLNWEKNEVGFRFWRDEVAVGSGIPADFPNFTGYFWFLCSYFGFNLIFCLRSGKN